MDMAMKLCENTQIGYFAFTRDLTVSLQQFQEYKREEKGIPVWAKTTSGELQTNREHAGEFSAIP
jgi:ribonucleoside-triphosphate reductase (formate)